LLDCEQAGFVTVVEISGVVADFVGEVDQLRFEGWALIQKILGEFGMICRLVVVRMLDDAFADFESQIESAEGGVAQFEVFDDTERVQVVVEGKSMLTHGCVESLFSGVAEGRMADVVDQGQRLDQVAVQSELGGDGTRDLRDFDGVGQAIAKVVGVAAGENLGLRFQASEGPSMDDTVAVALKIVAVGMGEFGMAASAGIFNVDGVVGELGVSSQLPAPSCQFTALRTRFLEISRTQGSGLLPFVASAQE